ncbi:MAG TPA: SEC-C metal-binding domain-containing protein, partial [Polyangia bacterium]|nr:SEC-C metal-binding domain-containing protein [Polyangia bacterium]
MAAARRQTLGAHAEPRVSPNVRARRPGPNDPCPCGRGEKYKRCHGPIDAVVPRALVKKGNVSPRREVPPEIPR